MSEVQGREEAGRYIAAVQGEFNIYSAAQLKDELLGVLNSHKQLDIDLGAVEDFDSSGVQILLMLKREAQRQGRSLTFTQHAPSVREVLDLLNLVAELGDPLVIPLDATGGRP
ncbi:STAS domain-containing protein [Aquipseudomonas guryensis]|jgi:anti-anti-sigma factor|uniref:STAS domain-containing protein n=1 Tax=Aquipseudomonas guryensis TaxID=2759165 RepID=A0A7W4DD42_9GAMM|nr:STAS domain-containing protein [Pseudomonas guryensis]MBB1520348.1 STAS domain-containing protein [Pseudomonas guryensis]